MSRTQEKINQPHAHVTAGIDVGKDVLDVYVHPANIARQFSNDKHGIVKLVRHCTHNDVRLAVLEATSKYHEPVHEQLHSGGIPVAIINPFRSRKFADATGQLAKSDQIDAKVLAQFARVMQPERTLPPSRQQKALRELNTARRQVLAEIGDLKRQLHTTNHPLAARQIRARIKMAERHKLALEQETKEAIRADKGLQRKFDILTSIPHIGAITAATLISDLTELGNVNCKQIAALAGVAPMSWDSGTRQGLRMIRGGRKSARNALYMCAVGIASKSNFMGLFYRKLIKAGKHPKIALTAVMRKLVILANTLINEDRLWQPARP